MNVPFPHRLQYLQNQDGLSQDWEEGCKSFETSVTDEKRVGPSSDVFTVGLNYIEDIGKVMMSSEARKPTVPEREFAIGNAASDCID